MAQSIYGIRERMNSGGSSSPCSSDSDINDTCSELSWEREQRQYPTRKSSRTRRVSATSGEYSIAKLHTGFFRWSQNKMLVVYILLFLYWDLHCKNQLYFIYR